jgi:acyl carrier protein
VNPDDVNPDDVNPDDVNPDDVNPDARSLLARLLHGIAPEVDLDEIDPAAPLQEAAELDSMDFLNLVTALYEETGIEIPERDYPLVATIDGFVAYLTAAHDTAADSSVSSGSSRSE